MLRILFNFPIKYLLFICHGIIFIFATDIIENYSVPINLREKREIKNNTINLEYFKQQILTIIPTYTACWGPCGRFSSDDKEPIRLNKSNKCHGLIDNCRYFTGPRDMGDARYCLSADKKSLLGVKTTFHEQFGVNPTKNCQGKQYKPQDGYCYCLCTCTANGNKESEHNWYFSSRKQQSDIANNKVVTGVRFVELNNVIYLQINEGVPRSKGPRIWRPVHNVSNADDNNNDDDDDKDIILITNYRRTMNLNQIYLPPDYVITGVKFTKSDDTTLCLEVQGTKFDTNKNQFVLNDRKWFNSNLKKQPFRNVSWTPTLYGYKKTNLQVKFRAENLEDDFGKTTIPRLSSLDICTKKIRALNAIRLSRIYLHNVETIIPQISPSKMIIRRLQVSYFHANETIIVNSKKESKKKSKCSSAENNSCYFTNIFKQLNKNVIKLAKNLI